MRLISFSLTGRAFLDGAKDVTRRLGWHALRPGDRLKVVRKLRGLKRGEHVHVLGVIEVVTVRREKLDTLLKDQAYGWVEVRREGFPDLPPADFVAFFRRTHRGCALDAEVTRIEFRRQ